METDQQTENLQLFLKIGNGPKKKRKPTQKKEETDQQTENLQLFLKIGNGPQKRENGPKKEETFQQNEI